MAQQPLVGQSLLNVEASRSYSDTPHSLGPDLYLTTQHTQQTDIHVPGGIRTCNSSKRAAADPRLSPRGHWHRQLYTYTHARICYDVGTGTSCDASFGIVRVTRPWTARPRNPGSIFSSTAFRPGQRSAQSRIHRLPGFVHWEKGSRVVKVTTQFHLPPTEQ